MLCNRNLFAEYSIGCFKSNNLLDMQLSTFLFDGTVAANESVRMAATTNLFRRLPAIVVAMYLFYRKSINGNCDSTIVGTWTNFCDQTTNLIALPQITTWHAIVKVKSLIPRVKVHRVIQSRCCRFFSVRWTLRELQRSKAASLHWLINYRSQGNKWFDCIRFRRRLIGFGKVATIPHAFHTINNSLK